VRKRVARFELLLLMWAVGCQAPTKGEPRVVASATRELRAALAPHRAGRFECRERKCSQQHPRLPDTGEWRCADREHVVWCAGGEPAAGVVSGPPDAQFRCGARWGTDKPERVCLDPQPDYPDDEHDYACSFEQEKSIVRVCRAWAPAPPRPLAAGAIPACWLDRDCPSGACDRGVCSCNADSQCQVGRCRSGACVEGKP
jgi:hypothetical protein